MFINNKYTKWYNLIIDSAQNRQIAGYVEKHHIIPKSLGGSDDAFNLVKLTAREHFICHLMLIKMTTGYSQKLMQHALGKFIQQNKFQERKFTSWEYNKIRENLSTVRKGVPRSAETKAKLSDSLRGKIPHNKGVTGVQTHSAETKEAASIRLKGKTFAERYGTERGAEIAKQISNSKLGKPGGMTNKTHSDETKKLMQKPKPAGFSEKISESRKGMKFSEAHLENLARANKEAALKRIGSKQELATCPHCSKEGGARNMKRYHFDNCKRK